MKITGIDHVVITASDMEKTLHFYIDVLGMTLHIAPNGQRMARFGDQQISFHDGPAEFLPAARRPVCGSADICLAALGTPEDIRRQLERQGVAVELGPVRRRGARGEMDSVYVRDPDGNLVEICVYPA